MNILGAGFHFWRFKIKRNFLYAVMLGLILSGYIILLLSLLDRAKHNSDLFLSIIVAGVCLAALGFDRFERQLRKITDLFFYKRRAGFHQTITEMLKQMNSCSELNALTELIVNTICNELKVDTVAFYLKSGNQKLYEIVKQKNWQDLDAISPDDALVQNVMAEKEVISKEGLLTFLTFPKYIFDSRTRLKKRELFYRMNSYQAEVLLPFFEKDELLGFILLGSKASDDPFFEDELHLLELIANQAVLGLKSSRLFEISQNKVKELTTLFEVGRLMGSTLDIKEIFASIIKSVIKVINVDRGILFLYNDQNEELYSVSGYGAAEKDIMGITLQVGDSVLGRIFRGGHPVLVPHITRHTEYVRRLGVESYVVVPMKAKDKIIGLLTIDNAATKRSLENINMDLLMTLAGQMAIAIENAQLYDDAQEKVKELSELNENILRLKTYNEDILKTMPSGVISFDQDGRIVTFNATAELITGYTAAEVINRSREELWSRWPSLLQALSREGVNIETNYQDRQGKSKALNISTRILTDNSAQQVGMLSVLTDISQLKMLEQQVRRSDRVSALGTMVAGVAHEIKNPLASMKMFVQLMAENKQNQQFWDEFGPIISNEVNRLESIVEDFLGFARTPEVNIKQVLLKDILDKVFTLVKTQSRKENVEILFHIDEDIWVNADTQKIMQVFLNLILNAIQAMPIGRQCKGQVKFKAQKDQNQNLVKITVEDNGCGISKKDQEKLFTPFFTTKQKGTGLGLSIAHKIIQEHDGTIDVESEEGKGTRFYITLPLVNVKVGQVVSTPVR